MRLLFIILDDNAIDAFLNERLRKYTAHRLYLSSNIYPIFCFRYQEKEYNMYLAIDFH